MATASVRKFAISVDPEEVVDFAEKIDYFTPIFSRLGFVQIGNYTFRYSDDECMLKAELQASKDGYFLYIYVQAMDEHAFRLTEIADAFEAHVIDRSRAERGSERIERRPTERIERPLTGRIQNPATGRIQKPGTGRIERGGT